MIPIFLRQIDPGLATKTRRGTGIPKRRDRADARFA